MTWFESVEQKRTLLITGVIAICTTALVVTTRRKPVAFDSFWHLQTGLDWIHKGLSPWVDHYSFTYSGKPISGQPVIFQAVLAWFVDNLGIETGFMALKLTAFALAFGLMIFFLKKLKLPTIAYLVILPLLTLLFELRAAVRPELLSYSLSIIAVMLYHRAHGKATWANVLPIALLMFLWTNYHSSTLGYILFFGFFVDAAFLQLREKADVRVWARWLFGGLLVLGAGALNKGFHLPVIGAINFSPEFESFIQEYQSAALYKGIIGVYSLIFIVLAVVGLSVKQKKFGITIVTLIFAYYSVRMVRLVTPCGIILLCLLASLLNELDLKATIARQKKPIRHAMAIGVCLVVLNPLYSAVMLARTYMQENRTSPLSRPELVVSYMQEQQLSGHIFNEYGIGGYLIYMLSPDIKVYIDGRTGILYPPSHLQKYTAARSDPEALLEEIKKHDINFALLESNKRTYSVMGQAGLGLDFADYKFALFTREEPNFPVTGTLLGNPACWDEAEKDQLEAEHAHAVMNLPRNSSVLPNLGFMLSYSRQSDRAAFLQEFAASGTGNEMQLRFAAYQALSLGLVQVSADLLERIEIWEHREFLAAAMAYTLLKDWSKAEEVIDSMTIVLWPHITRNDTVLLYRVLETIRRNRPLTIIPESFVEDLKGRANAPGVDSVSNLELDLALLCTS